MDGYRPPRALPPVRPPRESVPQDAPFVVGQPGRPERAPPPPGLVHSPHDHSDDHLSTTTTSSFAYSPASSPAHLPPSAESSTPPYSTHNHGSSSWQQPPHDQPYYSSTSPHPTAAFHDLPRVQFESFGAQLERPLSESSRANLLPHASNPNDQSQSRYAGRSSSHYLHTGGNSASNNVGVGRKKSLVRPDRERMDENHRLYNYRAHAAAMEAEGRGVAAFSSTGHYPVPSSAVAPPGSTHPAGGGLPSNATTNLRRGKSILAREEGMVNESGLSMFKRGTTLRRSRKRPANASYDSQQPPPPPPREPLGPWMVFCLILTCGCPSPLLRCFGLRTKERQRAWREKMGLLAVIGLVMAFVGYLTFGFTKSVCGTPSLRYRNGRIDTGSMIFHGYNYDMDKFKHPAAAGIAGGSNPLYNTFDAAAKDGSFLFQTVNEHCLNVITPATGTSIKTDGNRMAWYFPCNMYNQWGTSAINQTGYAAGSLCHTQTDARTQFAALKPLGQVYYTWGDLKNTTRNLGVYDGVVLDFNLLKWLDKSQVDYPDIFDSMMNGDPQFRARDITSLMFNMNSKQVARCLVDTIRVGYIDSVTIGCVASDVVLYVSLVVIIGVVVLRFGMAVFFGWFWSWRIGRFPKETYAERMARSAEIEQWTDDIYRPAPARFRPSVKPLKKGIIPAIPTTSRFTKGDMLKASTLPSRVPHSSSYTSSSLNAQLKQSEHLKRPPSVYGNLGAPPPFKSLIGPGMRGSPPSSPAYRSSTSLPLSSYNFDPSRSRSWTSDGVMGSCPFPLGDVVPQPPSDYEPFNYPLIHTMLLVTAYSESPEGIRTTLDSLATTDYPNSHKLMLVIADGMVKGSGNTLTTPEIVLAMMKDFIVQPEDVEAQSYVAIADGHKRHNRAKVYAGFYDYDDLTVERSKQQRVPIILVAKVGNDAEAHDPKPGNRGKRDSQIILMAFLQKVMFDERMTQFEYEFFNAIWRCTGVSPDKYETVLCVDADTKVFPDSVSRMTSCMVHDPEIMGLCGETKVANKSETWVTMIQVFEYYNAHHLSKAFESVFGGVTCLPGCFSMYRIKAPKGNDGYWVPILANPDVIEHYSENVVDTLHKKNLLLLGEDRFLTTLMLKTFPRRKMMFCPQAVCKTIVPDTFSVLLSQRRRWINSTVHNLFELILVPDLCGVFCFSMRFVIFMELVGTLVLPAAISFTIYLVVVAIIPGTAKPIISLILLGIILGIPGLLIVLTSRKVSYVGWMLVYLISLPIWNFVLPFYAFLHMDDFTWGQTRKVTGEGKGNHSDKDGEFDSSQILMKRWVDFERERRYRLANQSRDSTYDNLQRSAYPQIVNSNRYSTVSSVDTFTSGTNGSGAGDAVVRRASPGGATTTLLPSASSEQPFGNRYPQQLELPAPLSGQPVSPSSSNASIARFDARGGPGAGGVAEPFLPPSDLAQARIYDSSNAQQPFADRSRGLSSDYLRFDDPDESTAILQKHREESSPSFSSPPSFESNSYVGMPSPTTAESSGRESPAVDPDSAYVSSTPFPSVGSTTTAAAAHQRVGRPSAIGQHMQTAQERSESISSRTSNAALSASGSGTRPPSASSNSHAGSAAGGSSIGGGSSVHRRGFSLVDDGPVPGSRAVQRQKRASQGPTSNAPLRGRNSFQAADSNQQQQQGSLPASPSLPPGAAAPRFT